MQQGHWCPASRTPPHPASGTACTRCRATKTSRSHPPVPDSVRSSAAPYRSSRALCSAAPQMASPNQAAALLACSERWHRDGEQRHTKFQQYDFHRNPPQADRGNTDSLDAAALTPVRQFCAASSDRSICRTVQPHGPMKVRHAKHVNREEAWKNLQIWF